MNPNDRNSIKNNKTTTNKVNFKCKFKLARYHRAITPRSRQR